MTKAIRWTPEMLEAHRKKLGKLAEGSAGIVTVKQLPKRSKYAAEKVERAGEKFDSKKEARRWAELEMMQAEGRISDLQRQVAFVLAPAVRLDGEKRMKPALRYWADAVYVENGQKIVEDTKSKPTRLKESYRIKKHLMATVHGIQIKEV